VESRRPGLLPFLPWEPPRRPRRFAPAILIGIGPPRNVSARHKLKATLKNLITAPRSEKTMRVATVPPAERGLVWTLRIRAGFLLPLVAHLPSVSDAGVAPNILLVESKRPRTPEKRLLILKQFPGWSFIFCISSAASKEAGSGSGAVVGLPQELIPADTNCP
jgi:hypothetical protein